MADLKISELTAETTPEDTDLFVIVDNSGTPTTKRITLANSLKDITIAENMGIQGAVGNKGILLLSTLETTIVDNDKLGQIDFSAPSETTGTDSRLVAASVWAEADATFASDVNTTSLVFATGTSAVAAEKVRIGNTTGITIANTTTGITFGTATTGISLAGATTTGISIAGNATDAIKIHTGSFTKAINIASGTVGMSITGTTNTANALIIGASGTSSGDFIIYGQASGSYMHYDSTMTGDNKGRLIVANSSARFTLGHTINPCAVAITHTVDENTVVGGHGLWSTMVIGGIYSVTSTDYAHFVGVHGDAVIDGTLNGAQVHVYGVLGEIRGSQAQTVCNIVAAVAAKYNNAINPGTGDNCLYYGWSHKGVVDYGLFLESTGSGSITTGIAIGAATIGINISGASTSHAISISAAQTGSGYHVGDTWKLGFSDGAINIGGDATIAFGSVSDSVCVERVDVSAQMGAESKYVMGTYRTLATSGHGTGTALKLGIWMGDYTKMTIAHNTTDAYAVRGRLDISSAVTGNYFVAVMGSVDVTAALTAEATGGIVAGNFSISSSGSGTCNRFASGVYADMSGNLINLSGITSALHGRCGGSGYSDYILYAQVGNNLLQVAAIGITSTDSAIIPVGVLFAGGAGSITSAMTFTGTTTYFADFNTSTDGSPFTKTTGNLTTTCSGLLKVLDQDGVAGYINVWTA